MSLTLSPPIRIFAFVGVLAAVGLAAFLFLVGRNGDGTAAASDEPIVKTVQSTKPADPTPSSTPAIRAQKPRAAAVPASGFPLPIHRALRRNRVVVVVVYMPRASVDAMVRAEATAAAHASRAGLVQISALSERLVRPLVAKTGVLPDPAVLVVERPGVVRATLSVADRDTISQAVAQARR